VPTGVRQLARIENCPSALREHGCGTCVAAPVIATICQATQLLLQIETRIVRLRQDKPSQGALPEYRCKVCTARQTRPMTEDGHLPNSIVLAPSRMQRQSLEPPSHSPTAPNAFES
jgi:hypothetical protein